MVHNYLRVELIIQLICLLTELVPILNRLFQINFKFSTFYTDKIT